MLVVLGGGLASPSAPLGLGSTCPEDSIPYSVLRAHYPQFVRGLLRWL